MHTKEVQKRIVGPFLWEREVGGPGRGPRGCPEAARPSIAAPDARQSRGHAGASPTRRRSRAAEPRELEIWAITEPSSPLGMGLAYLSTRAGSCPRKYARGRGSSKTLQAR